jgi:two-component system, LuxR family, sensor kinase FixL
LSSLHVPMEAQPTSVVPRQAVRYGVAVLSALAAAFAGYELAPLWGKKLHFITFYPAVALSAWFGGLGPGLAATAASVACAFLLLQPSARLQINDFIGLTLFTVVNLTIATFNEALHRARRRAEVTAEAHRHSEEQLRGIVTSATDAIITIDAAQEITLFNAGAEAIFGYSADEMIGQKLDWLLPERFREVHSRHIDAFGRTGVSMRAMGGERVLAGVRRNGEEFPMAAKFRRSKRGGRSSIP